MRILVTGGDGQLGKTLRKITEGGEDDFLFADIEDFDITKPEECLAYLDKAKPDAVIHAAALTDVDLCEKDPGKCRAVNVDGTRNVLEAARRLNVKFLFISTDYVFMGDLPSGEAYRTTDEVGPISTYGRSKAAAEEIVRSYPKSFIVRTAGLFSPYRANFISKIIENARRCPSIPVVSDQIANLTYAKDLAAFLLELVHTEKYGIYHAANACALPRCSFARYVIEKLGLDCQVEPVSKMSFLAGRLRPANSALDMSSLTDNGFARLRDIHAAIDEYLGETK